VPFERRVVGFRVTVRNPRFRAARFIVRFPPSLTSLWAGSSDPNPSTTILHLLQRLHSLTQSQSSSWPRNSSSPALYRYHIFCRQSPVTRPCRNITSAILRFPFIYYSTFTYIILVFAFRFDTLHSTGCLSHFTPLSFYFFGKGVNRIRPAQ
jgi:hypothetical protein